MKPQLTRRRGAVRVAVQLGAVLLVAVPARAASNQLYTTVYSMAYGGYHRDRQNDGTFKPETYAFGKGRFGNGSVRDPSIDGLPFAELVRTLAPFLARQSYVPTPAPDQTDLLIVVHWGTTLPYDHSLYREGLNQLSTAMSGMRSAEQLLKGTATAVEGGTSPMGSTAGALSAQRQADINSLLMMMEMENRQRDMVDARMAALLGYLPEMKKLSSMRNFGGFSFLYRDLALEVEQERYYVILAAFDFRAAWKEKKRKLLWVTRVSIRARGHRFDRQLPAMLTGAAPYFGCDTPGLIRGYVPEGKVEVGEPKVLEVGPAPTG